MIFILTKILLAARLTPLTTTHSANRFNTFFIKFLQYFSIPLARLDASYVLYFNTNESASQQFNENFFILYVNVLLAFLVFFDKLKLFCRIIFFVILFNKSKINCFTTKNDVKQSHGFNF